MAETKMQSGSSERHQPAEGQTQTQRNVARREDYFPGRDLFSFSPFSMMRRLSEEMDRAFSSTFSLPRFGASGMWTPPVEVHERDGNLEISAELPGMNKDDVKIECTPDGVVIQGEKKRETESIEGGIHRTERSYGSFYRVIPLPEGADVDKAKAEFKNGVLNIKVPTPHTEPKTRRIPIGG